MSTTTTRELQRMSRGTTWDPKTNTASVILSTDGDVGDGVILPHTREAIAWPSRPLPLVVDHARSIDRVAGAVTALQLERIDGRQALTGRIELDGPAADLVAPLLRTGAARFSVAARVLQLDPGRRGGPDVATRWAPVELSAVVVGADPAAVLRSNNQPPEEGDSMTTTPVTITTEPAADVERSAADLKREASITRMVHRAGLDADFADQLVASDDSIERCSIRIFERMRDGLSQSRAGNLARGFNDQPASSARIADVLAAKFGVRDADAELRNVSLARALEPLAAGAGIALDRMSAARIIERAYSTSDFATALLASGERMVLQGYADAPRGVRALALTRPLADFRAVTMLRLSKFGSLAKKLEGGEYSSTTWSEEDAAILKADEYGRIAILSRKALVNDDLDIFGRLLAEMGASAARLEAELLAAQLLSGFTWDSANSTSSSNITSGIEAGTLKLRRQTDVGGNNVSFEPRLLLVPPEREAQARQVLSDRYMPNVASEVNPFPSIALEVDAQLTDGDDVYLVDTNYAPLALGTIGAPATTTEEHFETGNRKLRVQHDAAAAVADERSIVKITLS